MHPSIAAFVRLPPEQRAKAILKLSIQEVRSLTYCWEAWARPAQFSPPGNWRTWLVLAGRGWGKTRTGAEWVRDRVEQKKARRIVLAAPTAADIRDTVVEGESGIMAVSSPKYYPKYQPSNRRVTWPDTRNPGGSNKPGPRAICISADEPDRFRGLNTDTIWADELCSWQYPDAWDQLQFGLRSGKDPRACVTTTPKPTALIRKIIKDPQTYVTRGSTYENRANLASAFLERVRLRYEGTRLGRQELHAEVLDDAPGAMWNRAQLDALRVNRIPSGFRGIVVGVDPAVKDPSRVTTEDEKGAETGIVTCGLGEDGHGYVIRDDSGHFSPNEWAQRVVKVFDLCKANYVVAEVNQGGALVTANLRTIRESLPIITVHASRGKDIRAEPVSALYEQERIHHVGCLANLEDGMCQWDPVNGISTPFQDRIDAMVWAFTHLMVESGVNPPRRIPPPSHLRNIDDVNIF